MAGDCRVESVPGSLVQPLETSPHMIDYVGCSQRFDQLRLESSFRHSGWSHLRERVKTSLMTAGEPPNVVERFCKCGSNAWVMQSRDNPQRLKLSAFHCKHRLCLQCQHELRRVVAANLLARLDRRKVRFLTLTLRHAAAAPGTDEPSLSDNINRLYDSFAKLRRTSSWKHHVVGGVSFLEVKRTSQGWHPHLHILFDGKYFPQRELSNLWLRCTGDSYIVDIRDIPGSDSIRYITKYCTKVSPFMSEEQLVQIVHSLRSRRTFSTFGTWSHWKLSTPPKTDEVWIYLYPLHDVLAAADRGETWATQILAQLNHRPYLLPEGDFDKPPE
jgi:hypothetical protein